MWITETKCDRISDIFVNVITFSFKFYFFKKNACKTIKYRFIQISESRIVVIFSKQ